jgi:cell cycle serine/threonine-protein kinase CDC5/MSD2
VQQILTPNPQERPSLHNIVDHPFFTRGIVPKSIPVSARDMPPDFRHISSLISQENLARLRLTCQLDGGPAPTTSQNSEPPAPSVSSASSSLAQQEREFQKAVQPGSPISALLSSARQPLMVAPAGGTAVRGEPTLLRKLQAAKKEAACSPDKATKAGGRLQGIAEEDGVGDALERREEEVRLKELHSQKARIVAQMVPAQTPNAPESPFEDAENIPVTVPEIAQSERRARVRTKDPLPVLGETTYALLCWSRTQGLTRCERCF